MLHVHVHAPVYVYAHRSVTTPCIGTRLPTVPRRPVLAGCSGAVCRSGAICHDPVPLPTKLPNPVPLPTAPAAPTMPPPGTPSTHGTLGTLSTFGKFDAECTLDTLVVLCCARTHVSTRNFAQPPKNSTNLHCTAKPPHDLDRPTKSGSAAEAVALRYVLSHGYVRCSWL